VFPAPAYTYSQTVYGVREATVCLNDASFSSPGGHVGVWLGITDGSGREWLQGGIGVEGPGANGGTTPFMYVESKKANGPAVLRSLGPVAWGGCVDLVLHATGRTWRITVNGEPTSPTVRLAHPHKIATGESYGDATYNVTVAVPGREPSTHRMLPGQRGRR
jgi:hypothetical protein